MKRTQIAVDYPTIEVKVIKTAAEMQALGYKKSGDKLAYLPVNRFQSIVVKQVSRLVQEEFMENADYDAEMEEMCVAQTGMTPKAYQAKFKRSWNE